MTTEKEMYDRLQESIQNGSFVIFSDAETGLDITLGRIISHELNSHGVHSFVITDGFYEHTVHGMGNVIVPEHVDLWVRYLRGDR